MHHPWCMKVTLGLKETILMETPFHKNYKNEASLHIFLSLLIVFKVIKRVQSLASLNNFTCVLVFWPPED